MEPSLIQRVLLCALLCIGFANSRASEPAFHAVVVDFPADRIPQFLWARELVWLHNIGVDAIASKETPAQFRGLVTQAGLALVEPEAQALRVSALDPNALTKSRMAMHARKQVLWIDVESEASPIFRKGAVSLSGDESKDTQPLRREALVSTYWAAVLDSAERSETRRVTGLELVEQRFAKHASALGIVNASRLPWHGSFAAALPSFGREIQIPNVTVPAHDALLLPVDVSFSDQRFCRSCTGMSNTERLLYATSELTGLEYENGILAFEFYAPVAGMAVLQLERQPEGPMLAGGRPAEFDWDPDSKRARLPIPAGKGDSHEMRIAIAISDPEHVASFAEGHVLILGETNKVTTDYTPPEIAARSRLIVPDQWPLTSETKLPQVIYNVTVPADRLHGDKVDLRIETDGLSVSHRRVQLLRPVSVHVAEATAVHFGTAGELLSDPPLVPVETPNGRTITVQVKNNAPEIRTFTISASGEGVEFSPEKSVVTIGASSEREISLRVFTSNAAPGMHLGDLRISGATTYEKPLRLVTIPRTDTVSYQADLLGNGAMQQVWENTHLRSVFSREDGGRWIELYWKPSGKSLLPPEGIAIGGPVRIGLTGSELTFTSLNGSPLTGMPRGGHIGSVDWTAESTGPVTRYRVRETISPR